jgi:uncharacterized protein YdiU (UPF0061 family)
MYSALAPSQAPAPKLHALNHRLIKQLGLQADWFNSAEAVAVFSGNADYRTQPLAIAYAGHQFGGYSPLLGDGRAHMLGQLQTANGDYLDVQLKGSGATPYSRRGDGKATLSSSLREYLISEAMAGLEIPTTNSLAVIGTGELVQREQPQAGGIVVRTAQSHIRVGSFQYAGANLEQDELQALADFVISHHFPEITHSESPYAALIEAVAARQAALIPQWMLVGFIHGVMNTDNMSVVGETIDFGPCAFMDEFIPSKTFSSIDHQGRYAWNQQGSIAYWNLARFAETLLPLLDEDSDKAVTLAENALKPFQDQFRDHFVNGLKQKLGITRDDDAAQQFVEQAFPVLAKDHTDFTVFFNRLTELSAGSDEAPLLGLFSDQAAGAEWVKQWREFSDADVAIMRQANPVLIARNHQVEKALADASERDDWALFNRLAKALANPYHVAAGDLDLLVPPEPQERVMQTFCGT